MLSFKQFIKLNEDENSDYQSTYWHKGIIHPSGKYHNIGHKEHSDYALNTQKWDFKEKNGFVRHIENHNSEDGKIYHYYSGMRGTEGHKNMMKHIQNQNGDHFHVDLSWPKNGRVFTQITGKKHEVLNKLQSELE